MVGGRLRRGADLAIPTRPVDASEPTKRLGACCDGAVPPDAPSWFVIAALLALVPSAAVAAPSGAPPTSPATGSALAPPPLSPPPTSLGATPPIAQPTPANAGATAEEDGGDAVAEIDAAEPSPAASVADEADGAGDDVNAEADVAAPKLVGKRSIPPFWIDRTYDTHRTRALTLPPLFIHRTPTPAHPEKLFHADLSLTFGWYGQAKGKRRYISPFGLFFGSFSERTTAWGSGVLLMGYKRTGEQFNFGQFPFVWWWGNKYVRNLFVLPFHYHQKTPESRQAMSGVLFWYGHKNLHDADPLNDLRYFVGAPLFVRVQKGVKRVDVGLPLYIGGEDKVKGLRHRTLLPFFHWHASEFDNRRELWTLPFVYRRDQARQTRSWVLPPLLTFSKRGPTRTLFSATPLVWRATDSLRASTTWVVGPWISHADPEQRINVLAPLWWNFADRRAGVSTSVLAPLAIARRSADETAVYTLLGGGRRAKDGGFGVALPPLLTFASKRPQGRSYQVVTPLFWHIKNPAAAAGKGSDHWVVPPFFYTSRVGEGRRSGLLPALTFTGREGTRSYQVVTPLFWHFRDRDPERAHHTFVVPPFYVRSGKLGWAFGVPPLVVAGRDPKYRYTVVPPLLSGDVTDLRDGRRLTVSPFFVRSARPGERTLGVLGLAWDVRREGERHTAVFPLFYRRQVGERSLWLTPIGGGWGNKGARTWFVGPVFGGREGERRTFGVLPLFASDVRPAEGGGVARHTVLAPLYLRRRTPTDDLDMVTPLFWRTRVGGEKPRKNLALVPFYFRQRQPGGVDVDAGVPFFYSRDPRRRTHTLIAGLGFHRLTRTSLNAGVLPFYWWKDSAEERRLLALPLVYHHVDKGSKARTTFALPLWFDRRRSNGSRFWIATPFVLGRKGQYNFTNVSMVPPGYFDIFRLGKSYRFTGFAPLLFRYQKCGFREDEDPSCRYTLWGSPLLYMGGRDGRGRSTHSALGLFYFDRGPTTGTSFFTWAGGFKTRPGEQTLWYVGPFGRNVTRTHATTALFPVFLHRKHRTEDRSTTLVLPPLYAGQHREDFRWNEVALVFWSFRRPHKVATAIVPPIFYISHTYAERRVHWLLPLYLRDNNMGRDRTWTSVFPALYFQRRNGEDLDVVQFPLLWHIERGKNQGTVGAFLWWDIRRKGATTQVLPGLFVRRVNRRGETFAVVGPGLGWWSRSKTRAGPGLHWRALFGLIGGGNEAGNRYFSLFGGRLKLKPKTVWEPRRKVKAKGTSKGKIKGDAKGEAKVAAPPSPPGK